MDIKNKIILALQKNKLSEIEKDILLEDLRAFYSILKNEKTETNVKDLNKTETTTYSPPIFKESEKTEQPKTINPIQNFNSENPTLPTKDITLDKNTVINEVTTKDLTPIIESSSTIDVNEKFKNQSSSDVNKQFKQDSISINKKPFKNIADSLDLNTRIFLSQSLFSNNMNLLLVFIEELDKKTDLSSSMDFIHDELGEGNDQNAIEKIQEMVKSKFNS